MKIRLEVTLLEDGGVTLYKTGTAEIAHRGNAFAAGIRILRSIFVP